MSIVRELVAYCNGCGQRQIVTEEIYPSTWLQLLDGGEAKGFCSHTCLMQQQSAAAVPARRTFPAHLTLAEVLVIEQVALGYRNGEIALHLGLKERTIRNRLTNIMQKLNAYSRIEVLLLALRLGVVSLPALIDQCAERTRRTTPIGQF